MIPDDRRYTAEHEWARPTEDGAVLRIGITDFAQDRLGDIVFVSLPEVGDALDAGQYFGEVESTKSVSDLYAPVAGTVTARNDALEQTPELVNGDPFGEGWMLEIQMTDRAAYDDLLDAGAYGEIISAG
ncbi:MAG: glycine cleavage system protein GcvH [Geodermatophilaceae bacterium]|nr:glycine cleavage system protein GcvH [Geodermatophilaceae bacterium]